MCMCACVCVCMRARKSLCSHACIGVLVCIHLCVLVFMEPAPVMWQKSLPTNFVISCPGSEALNSSSDLGPNATEVMGSAALSFNPYLSNPPDSGLSASEMRNVVQKSSSQTVAS